MNRRERFERLHEIREVAEGLRASPIEAPDFTSSILDRVDVERPFLAPSVRRRLPWIRMGLGVCVATTALGIALTHRWAPKAVQVVSGQPAPISDVVQCVECAAYNGAASFRPVRLNVSQRDASEFLAAMATMANLAENEGRGPVAGETSLAMTPIAPMSQVVAINASMPPTTSPSGTRALALFRPSIHPAQSVLGETSVHTMLFSSSDVPKVRVVPSFLEHDLDGLVLPR